MKRILIIDDDIALLDVLKESLQYSDYDVKTVDHCHDIFNLIKEYKPHAVILDYLLSGINGGEICHQIKTNPETGNLPVILITAYPRILESLGVYHSDAIIPKPFDLSELLQTVDSCVANYAVGAKGYD